MSPEEIKKILEEHEVWLGSDGKEGERADLLGVDLQNFDLLGVNLENAVLQGANFQNADLEGANLKGANLKGANLEGANLGMTNLEMTNLKGANLEGANLEMTNLEEANLERAKLRKANLKRASLVTASLRGASLRGASLQRASLILADLQGADLRDAYLWGASLLKAKLDQVILDRADLRGIYIDTETTSKLPRSVIERYGPTFFVRGGSDYEDNKNLLIRSIEFPSEYHQAGISILNYFGSVLRKKYPEQNAKIRIEQEGLKVTMIVDPLEGDREVIEKALDEYGLVVTGKMSPEKYTNDPIQAIELRNELRMATTRIESQKELLQYQNVQVEKLYSLIDQAIQKPVHTYVQVDAKSKAELHLSQEIKFALNLTPMIHGGLNEIKEQLKEGTKEADTVQELQNSLDKMDACNSKDEIKKSSAMSKFRRFLEDVDKTQTTAGKVIKTTKDGIDIARRLAGYYNEIAQWCGLPQVPKPFTKD
jgi:uncharacterized protein YjbI with pentapeptide repeats